MESIGIKTLIAALFLTAVLAARPKCGKRAFRAKYGTQGSFQSLEGTKATCKYRIRSAPGLHISLVLDNYFPDPTDLLVSIAMKKVKNAKTILVPPGPRASLIVEASNVILTIKTSASGRPIDISHEAVIPADGNFGYDFEANRKPKVLSSPGFPKTKLPSGIGSIWRVTSTRGDVIDVEIRRLSTSCDEDYVEILDGSVSIGRYCGRKENIAVRASSGIMVVRLHTETATSKGFKAIISSSLQCHKRLKMTTDGIVTTDAYSRMTCSGTGEICGRMVVEGNSSVSGANQQLTREALHCIPSNLCIGNCGNIPLASAVPGMVVKTCALSCCSTDFCNKSPDGPDEPPATPAGLRCSESSEVTRSSGLGLGSASSGDFCPPDSTCALYVFSGLSGDDVREKVVGYVAKCTTAASCNEDECHNLYETSDVNVASCNVTCCREDGCNDPGDATIPTLPPTEPKARSCYSVKKLQIGSDIHTNIQRYTECSLPQDRCLRVDANIVDSNGRNGVASFGKCVPKSSCEDMDCEPLLELDGSITATTCAAVCCPSDMCNELPVAIPSPSSVPSLGSVSQCYETFQASIGTSSIMDNVRAVTCDPDSVCIRIEGTATRPGVSAATIVTGKCYPKATCEVADCRTLINRMPGLTLQECRSKCCDKELCNDQPITIVSPGVEAPKPRQCYDIVQTKTGATYRMNRTTATTCAAGSACSRVEAVAAVSGIEVAVVYGSCVPEQACEALTCDTLSSVIPGMTLRDCESKCCLTDLCNIQPFPVTTMAGSPATSPSVAPPDAGGARRTITCHNKMYATSAGVTFPGGRNDVETCPPGSQCMSISAVASHSSLPAGMQVTINFGTCAPPVICHAKGCSTLPEMPGVTIESCDVSCCDTDLCNA